MASTCRSRPRRATTSIRSCDSESRIFVRRHPGFARGDEPRVDLDADAAARRHLGRARGEARRAHVLDGHDVPGADQLERRLDQQLLGERIAHLHLRPPGLALCRQLLGRERGAVDAVATGAGADGDDRVPGAGGAGPDQLVLAQQAHAHRVDEGIPLVGGLEGDVARHGGDADAVAVVADAAHHALHQVALPVALQGAEAERVEHGDGTGAHGEDVAQDAAHAGGGALVGLHGRRVVVRFHLEGDGPALADPDDAGVFAGPLDHLRAVGGEGPEHGARVLVRAVLAPQRGEDAQLDVGGIAAQDGPDAAELFGGETVLANQLRGEGRVPGAGVRRRHWPGLTRTPVTAPVPLSAGAPCGGVYSGWRPSGELLCPA